MHIPVCYLLPSFFITLINYYYYFLLLQTHEKNYTVENATEESTHNETDVKIIEPKRMREVKISKTFEFLYSMDTVESNSSERTTQVPQRPELQNETESSKEESKTSVIQKNGKEQSVESSLLSSSVIGPRGRRYPLANSMRKLNTTLLNATEQSIETNKRGPSRDSRSLKASLVFENLKFPGPLGNQTELFNTNKSKLRSLDIGTVQVRMQNTTMTETGGTRLIYSVHLGGKPVPAETAAKDMALLSPQEVALELGVPVIIQSERKNFFFCTRKAHK